MSDAFFFAKVMQFLRPNDKQQPTELPLPANMKDLYDRMEASGHRFETKLLQTGEVSMTITRLDTPEREGEDVDIRITRNGPPVQDGMIEMLVAKRWEEGGDEQDSDGGDQR